MSCHNSSILLHYMFILLFLAVKSYRYNYDKCAEL